MAARSTSYGIQRLSTVQKLFESSKSALVSIKCIRKPSPWLKFRQRSTVDATFTADEAIEAAAACAFHSGDGNVTFFRQIEQKKLCLVNSSAYVHQSENRKHVMSVKTLQQQTAFVSNRCVWQHALKHWSLRFKQAMACHSFLCIHFLSVK